MKRTWQQRRAIIAAVLFVLVLVGSLIVVLVRARQSSSSALRRAMQVEALSSIQMLGTQTGWAITERGQILRTTDGSRHWKEVTPNYPSTSGHRKVMADFLTNFTAWVAVSQAPADG